MQSHFSSHFDISKKLTERLNVGISQADRLDNLAFMQFLYLKDKLKMDWIYE